MKTENEKLKKDNEQKMKDVKAANEASNKLKVKMKIKLLFQNKLHQIKLLKMKKL